MTLLVVDASIIVKWFLPEIHSVAALRVAESDRTFVAPDLLGAEVTNVFWKKIRRSELTAEEGRRLSDDFGRLDIIAVPHDVLLPTALDLAVEVGHPVYDCLYLALARRSDCRLVTADRHFYNAFAQREGGSCLTWVEDF